MTHYGRTKPDWEKAGIGVRVGLMRVGVGLRFIHVGPGAKLAMRLNLIVKSVPLPVAPNEGPSNVATATKQPANTSTLYVKKVLPTDERKPPSLTPTTIKSPDGIQHTTTSHAYTAGGMPALWISMLTGNTELTGAKLTIGATLTR